GRDSEEYGESVVAIVTPKPGTDLTLEDLRTFGRDLIADYKLPRDLILDEIPRNPSGKILKHRLRDRFNA
ncbi:MAG: o-succinylbenzoate--CoA ligase, partial [Dermatophilaceae bacterium]